MNVIDIKDKKAIDIMNKQRTAFNQKKLPKDKINLLEKLPGWFWSFSDKRFNDSFIYLEKYYKKFGTSKVKNGFIFEDGFKLSAWVNERRKLYRKNKISEERIRKFKIFHDWKWD